jgi:hypothetical protein
MAEVFGYLTEDVSRRISSSVARMPINMLAAAAPALVIAAHSTNQRDKDVILAHSRTQRGQSESK